MCLPKPVTSKLGIFGRIIDPGLATSELVGKVSPTAGKVLNPGEWKGLLTPEQPKQPNYGRDKGQLKAEANSEQAAIDERYRKAEDAKRKRTASLLTSDAKTPTEKGNSILTGSFSGLESPTTGGLKSLLGT